MRIDDQKMLTVGRDH